MSKKDKILLEKLNESLEEYKRDVQITPINEIDGAAIITIDLTKDIIYKSYSNQTLLEDGIFETIEYSMKFIKINHPIKFNIIFPEDMLFDEKRKIEKLIKIHYAIKTKVAKKEKHNTNIKSLILLFLGSIFFIIYGLLQWYNVNFIFINIIEIFSWVFIWVACEELFFTKLEKQRDILVYLKLFKSEFIDN